MEGETVKSSMDGISRGEIVQGLNKMKTGKVIGETGCAK